METFPASADFSIEGGKYNITINNRGTERWDVQFRHRGLTIERGHTYTVKFTVSATKDCKVYPKIGDQGEPYDEYWNYNMNWDFVELRANTPVTITQEFTMNQATKIIVNLPSILEVLSVQHHHYLTLLPLTIFMS